jgi:hypothetical protein
MWTIWLSQAWLRLPAAQSYAAGGDIGNEEMHFNPFRGKAKIER